MPVSTYHTPGVYVQEIPAGPRPIQAVVGIKTDERKEGLIAFWMAKAAR
jgi:hypothetical protein